MSLNMGVAEGYVDLNIDALRDACTKAAKEIQKIGDVSALTQAEVKQMESVTKGVCGTFESAKQKAQALTRQIEAAEQKTEAYRKGIKELNTMIDASKQQQAQLEDAIKKANDRLDKAREKYGETSTQAQKYRDEITRMQSEHDILGTRIEDCESKILQYKTSLTNTETEIINFTRELEEAQNKVSTWGTVMEGYGGKLEQFGGGLSKIGGALTLGVTTPILGIGTAAIKAGNEFEAQMSRVSAIAQAYGPELEKLRDLAIDLGAETSFSATEAAQAMENLASAGFGVDEIMEAMPGMLALAASSGEDLASSAEIAAGTLRGFGLESEDLMHVADVLAKNAADTNAAIMDTGYAMKYVAPVAHSVGWSLEEVTAAIGVLADANIKGEQAGTTLRGALTRLMKPTDDMQVAMDDLGVSFYDAEGKMKPLSTMIDELQTATKGMTDEQRNQRIATIFGTNALSGMEVLLKSSKTELDNLTEGLKNSDGAAQNMADTMLDNTKGSIEEMSGALETAAITVQEKLAPWVTKGAEAITDLANGFSDLDEETQGTILKFAGVAAAAGPVSKVLGSVTGSVGKLVKGTGGLIKDLGKISSAKKAAKAIGELGSFSVKSVDGVSGLSKVLSKLASPTGIAIAAAGAIAGIGTAMYGVYQQHLDDKIAEQFGDITLSAEEVEDVAKRLTETEWTMKLDAYVEAKDKLDEFEEEINDSIETLDKLDWKVSVGMELTEEEKQSYKDSITSYIQSTQEYIEQQRYTAKLSIDAVLTQGTALYENVAATSEEYYSGLDAELTKLGNELAQLVNDAFNDGVLSDEEIEQIADKRAELQKMIAETEAAEYDLKLTNVNAEMSKPGISKETYEELKTEREELLKARQESMDEAALAVMIPYQIQLNQGEITQAEFDKAFEGVQLDKEKKLAKEALKDANDYIDTLYGIYSEELGWAIREANLEREKAVSENIEEYLQSELPFAVGNLTQFRSKIEASGGALKELRNTVNDLEPSRQQMTETAETCLKYGQSVPEYIKKGLSDIYEKRSALGEIDGFYHMVGKQIAESPEYFEMFKKAQKSGARIPEAVLESVEIYSDQVYDETTGMWTQMAKATEDAQGEILNITAETVEALRDTTISKIEGIEPDVVSAMSALGFDTGKSFNDNLSTGIGDNIQVIHDSATGAITSFKNTASKATVDATPELVRLMEALGVDMNEAASGGLNSKVLTLPEIATAELTKTAYDIGVQAAKDIQRGLDTAKLSTEVELKGFWGDGSFESDFIKSLPGHADGGIVNQPEIALIGEDGPESIIPLSASRRASAIELWEQTGEQLGIRQAYSQLFDEVSAMNAAREFMAERAMEKIQQGDGFDYDLLADKLAKKLRESPIKTEASITIQNDLSVDLDSETIGRKVTPTVSRIIANRSKM